MPTGFYLRVTATQGTSSRENYRALDCVHRGEDVCQKLTVPRALLELGKRPLHAVQSLLAFNQEFAVQLVHLTLIGETREELEELSLLNSHTCH